LGHATRCIPLIYTLQELGCNVIIAADGASRTLLVEEFPQLTHLPSPHTEVRYARYQWLFGWAILKLLPRFWLQLQQEQKWIRTTVQRYKIDAIISDNRYGLSHPNIPAVLITHQLGIRTGYGQLADRLVQQFLYRYINRYQEVWVPDRQTEPMLAGALSHPHHLPSAPLEYIGVLNRLKTNAPDAASETTQLLVLLSGPEPQRTLLEKIILKQAASFTGQLLLVRGLPSSQPNNPATASVDPSLAMLYGVARVRIVDHLTTAQLQQVLPSADFIVCRSGYTTLMEMIPLQKKLLLIPTPGQPEQAYLADYADRQRYAPQFLQQNFSLGQAIQVANQYPYRFPAVFIETPRTAVVTRFIDQLKHRRSYSH
jgi:UDP:flavonoid glycosyltransferase YjiC (YdhE family)